MSNPEIFDASVYDLPVPRIDGIKADRILVHINGTFELDRTDTTDLEFLDQLRGGHTIRLNVDALVAGKAPVFRQTDDGIVMTYTVKLKATQLNR